MNINKVRTKYPNYKISYLPKKDYLIGIDDTKSTIKKRRRKDIYDEVYLAKNIDNKYYLLYPTYNFLTGSFINRQKAIDWFKNGGR